MAIVDVIKYEGDNSTFVWKHPCEDFNTKTQLIVHESQEAIFFMNGQALDLFGPGRHLLETENIPLLSKLFNNVTGGDKPFHCEVYFINKTVQMAIKWGTDSKVRFIEPTLGFPLEIGACGEMNLQVSDSRKLLVKLVGTTNGIAWDNVGQNFTKSLCNCFRPLISTAIKTNLASTIKTENINILEIDEHLEHLSEILRKKISTGFEEYGLTIPQFFLSSVLLPENDVNFNRMKELHTIALQTQMAQAEAIVKTAHAEAAATVTAAQRKVELERQATETEIAKRAAERRIINAQAEAQSQRMQGLVEAEIMQAKGYNQKDVLQAEVQKAYAEGIGNMGSQGGGTLGDIVGISAGLAAIGVVGPQLSGMFKDVASPQNTANSQEQTVCPKCGNKLPANAKFCLECGTKVEKLADNEIICPHCGHKTIQGKFCLECGNALVNKCPDCGTECMLGAKFCPNCGKKL